MAIQYDLSGRAFALEIGVDEKAVRKAVVRGDLKYGYNAISKKFNLEEAKRNQWVQDQLLVRAKAGVSKGKVIEKLEKQNIGKSAGGGKGQKPPKYEDAADEDLTDCTVEELLARLKVTSNMPRETALKYTEIVELALAKLKLQKEAGVLVAKVDVEKELFAKGRLLKQDVMNIAESTIDDVLAAPNRTEAMNVLKAHCNGLLDRYSKEEQLMMKNE